MNDEGNYLLDHLPKSVRMQTYTRDLLRARFVMVLIRRTPQGTP